MSGSPHTFSIFRTAMLCALSAVASLATAQPSLATARATYESEIAACNSGLPAPQRDACVRQAGAALDEVRRASPQPANVAPSATETTTLDGRATIVKPNNAPAQNSPSTAAEPSAYTTQDGRATIIDQTQSTVPGDGSGGAATAP